MGEARVSPRRVWHLAGLWGPAPPSVWMVPEAFCLGCPLFAQPENRSAPPHSVPQEPPSE